MKKVLLFISVIICFVANSQYRQLRFDKLTVEDGLPENNPTNTLQDTHGYIRSGGIPQKVLYKIYQPLFTTKPTRQGTGLGLSLSYDILTKGHGGEMKVETKEGEGAHFIIKL